MNTDGHKSSANRDAELASLSSKREKLQEELRSIEKQVYELETSYLEDSSNLGNALKGYKAFLSSSKNASNSKKPKKLQPEDRKFSLSSVTSPLAEEHKVGQDDGKSHLGIGRSKSGTVPANKQAKKNKGRTRGAARDAKRTKQFNEAEFDDEDDLDITR